MKTEIKEKICNVISKVVTEGELLISVRKPVFGFLTWSEGGHFAELSRMTTWLFEVCRTSRSSNTNYSQTRHGQRYPAASIGEPKSHKSF